VRYAKSKARKAVDVASKANPESKSEPNLPEQTKDRSQIGNVQIVSSDEVNTIDLAADAVPLVSPQDLNTIDLAATAATKAPPGNDATPAGDAKSTVMATTNAPAATTPATPDASTAVASASQPEAPENSTWLRRILFTLGGAFAAASAFRIFLV
jgi:hypothetical protein